MSVGVRSAASGHRSGIPRSGNKETKGAPAIRPALMYLNSPQNANTWNPFRQAISRYL
jgi:hypothetical protein